MYIQLFRSIMQQPEFKLKKLPQFPTVSTKIIYIFKCSNKTDNAPFSEIMRKSFISFLPPTIVMVKKKFNNICNKQYSYQDKLFPNWLKFYLLNYAKHKKAVHNLSIEQNSHCLLFFWEKKMGKLFPLFVIVISIWVPPT